MGGDEKTFKVNFTSDGIERLKNEVAEKLKEFMGDYTDDTLVEYVIVLLRNGRTKDEARNELNVFLGDEDSNSFVTLLWDHLSTNLNLYVQSDDSSLNAEAKQTPILRDLGKSQNLQNQNRVIQTVKVAQIADDSDITMDKKYFEHAAKPSHLRSVIGQTNVDEKSQCRLVRTRKSLSPRPSSCRKRNRIEEKHQPERKIGLASINPSSRLLQSAVREAVGLTSKTTEPGAKRLRSVVASSTVDDSRSRLRSVAMVSSIAGVAIKAAAEAAGDVLRARPLGNVFDRLGRGVDVVERTTEFTDSGVDEDLDFKDSVVLQSQLNQRRGVVDSRRYADELIKHEAEFTIDLDEDSDYEADTRRYRSSGVLLTSSSVQMDNDSARTRYGNTANSYQLKRTYQNQPVGHPSFDKYVNAPVDADLLEPRPQMSIKASAVPYSSRLVQGGDMSFRTSGEQLTKKNSNGLVAIGNGKSALFQNKELPTTQSTATGSSVNVVSTEDADARTIFVSNVHFAATKDSLSRHFSKFGQVLGVTNLTDGATGQPRGSAYVEFMLKEAAVQATSLNGTSFMSRIIKVCMKGSTQPESQTPTTTAWPRALSRGSPYPIPRFRSPFPRGNLSSFRGRGIARPGARSLQWKRDAQLAPATTSDPAGVLHANGASVRSLTYVRPELKVDGSST